MPEITKFNLKKAREAGYTEEEIQEYLEETYGLEETQEFLKIQKVQIQNLKSIENKIDDIQKIKENTFKVEVQNLQAPPEIQKVEITNPEFKVTNQIGEVVVKDLQTVAEYISDSVSQETSQVIEAIKEQTDEISTLSKTVLKVEVKNQKEVIFPETQKVEVLNPTPPTTVIIPETSKIANSIPSEAIPVRLVDITGKSFYEAVFSGSSGGGGIQTYKDDTAFGVGTSRVVAIGGLADETAPDSVDEGDIGAIRMSLKRSLYTIEQTPTTVSQAQVSTVNAGTRVQLGANSCLSVTIKAKHTNSGFIYVGDVTVTSANGFALLAGESISFNLDNTNRLYIDSSVNAEGVYYTWVNT